MYAITSPVPQFFDLSGDPLDAGKIYIGTAGSNPITSPVTVYWDDAGTQPAAQPIRTVSGYPARNGKPARIYVATDDFSITVTTRQDVLVQSELSALSIGMLRSDLALSTGSSLIGFIQNGAGAVARAALSKMRDSVSVKDFGAVGDGVTDDTDAIANCIAASANIGVIGGGAKIIFPKGTYLCSINLVGSLNNSMGEYGVLLSGYGATLKGRASDTSVIQGNGCIATVPDPNPGGSIYVSGTSIEGFTIDMRLMANSASVYGISMQHAYNSSIRDVHVVYEPNLGGGLFLGSQTYTWSVDNLNCSRVKIRGYNNTTNLSSSMTFKNLVANQVVLENFFMASFTGGVVQGPIDKFVYIGAQAITVTGMDLEGPNTGECVHNFLGGGRYVTSIGNSCGGYTTQTYSKGTPINSNLADRPNLPGNTIGVYGRVNSQGQVQVSGSNIAMTGVSITGTSGQFSCASSPISIGDGLQIFGTIGGTGSIGGYSGVSKTYFVVSTNGSTEFTLSESQGGSPISTTVGTPTGLTYLLSDNRVPIYYFTDVELGFANGLFVVSGDNGNWGFSDLVLVAYDRTTVVSSNNIYGPALPRVYFYDSTGPFASLTISINSSSSSVRCVAVENLR